MASPRFDIVVFGASGFTGKYMVAEVARAFMEDPTLTFAIAGRNAQKLQEALNDVLRFHSTGHTTLTDIKKIIANVDNEKSLCEMAAQAKVIINCVGPYAYYGEAVVKACIKMKCSHVDISGEQIFLDLVKLKYDIDARLAEVYIVGAVGFDSIPSDLGVMYTYNKFAGDLNTVEGYFKFTSTVSGGPSANYGTFASAVNIFRDKSKIHDQSKRLFNKELPKSRHLLKHSEHIIFDYTERKGAAGNHGTFESAVNVSQDNTKSVEQNKLLFDKKLPVSPHRLPSRRQMFYCDDVSSWCHRFPGCDRSIVKRTQYQFYSDENRRPVQYGLYLAYDSMLPCLGTVIGFIFFMAMCSMRITRWLMLLFPDIFTLGTFSRKGPTRDKVANTSFSLTMIGRGYKTKITDPNTPHTDEPTETIVTRVTGPDMGYITTPICAVTSALCILKERNNLPPQGGVFTPAGAFAKTTMIERLDRRGVSFRVVEAQHHKVEQ